MSFDPTKNTAPQHDLKSPLTLEHRDSATSTDNWDGTTQAPSQAGDLPSEAMYHIYHSNTGIFSSRTLGITLNDKKSVVWHVTFPRGANPFSSKPDIQVQRSSADGPVVGTARYHSFSPDEISFPVMKSASTTLERDGMFTRRHRIKLDGKPYYWKGTHQDASVFSSGNLKFVDGDGRVYAVFMSVEHKAIKKVGRLSIVVPGLDERLLEQIVVSCMVLYEKERREDD